MAEMMCENGAAAIILLIIIPQHASLHTEEWRNVAKPVSSHLSDPQIIQKGILDTQTWLYLAKKWPFLLYLECIK